MPKIYTYLYIRQWLTSRCAGSAARSRISEPFLRRLGARPAISFDDSRMGSCQPIGSPLQASARALLRSDSIQAWSTEYSYVAKFTEAIYVLHAFEKRTRQTPQADLELARKRLAAVVQARRSL